MNTITIGLIKTTDLVHTSELQRNGTRDIQVDPFPRPKVLANMYIITEEFFLSIGREAGLAQFGQLVYISRN